MVSTHAPRSAANLNMTDAAALQSNFDEMIAAELMDYNICFGPVDPQIGLPQADGMPELLSTAGQIDLSVPAWNDIIEPSSTSPFTRNDIATSANHDASGGSPCSSIASNIDLSTAASQLYTASSSSLPPSPEVVPKKRSKGRASQKREKGAISIEAKRSQSLKRNRVAASKCRRKKKVWQHNLEEQENRLETQHSLLQKEHDELSSEVNQIKYRLMAHASCEDCHIDQWIENQAMQFACKARQRTSSNASTVGGAELRNGLMTQASPATHTGRPRSPSPQSKAEDIDFDHA